MEAINDHELSRVRLQVAMVVLRAPPAFAGRLVVSTLSLLIDNGHALAAGGA